MNKKIFIFFTIIIIGLAMGILIIKEKSNKKFNFNSNIYIVPTMDDKINEDSAWCGTFQLVWNDMKNEVIKNDIVFNPQIDIVKNLNKEKFKENDISSDYYFKIYGPKNLELKKKIEKGIKEKFNQTSDILNDFNWKDLDDKNNKDIRKYFFYTMLYREFEFLYKFDRLENNNFNNYKNVKYFGINKNTDEKIKTQIEVLFYKSKDDFAILIKTKSNDEVIFYKNPIGNTFNEIYNNMNNSINKYNGSKNLSNLDEFKVPYLEFKQKNEFKELEHKPFKTNDPNYPIAEIEKAIQTINFSLNEKGGKIKSEAAIEMYKASSAIFEHEKRYFNIDNTFAIFLRESGKDKPYFASKITDITKVQ